MSENKGISVLNVLKFKKARPVFIRYFTEEYRIAKDVVSACNYLDNPFLKIKVRKFRSLKIRAIIKEHNDRFDQSPADFLREQVFIPYKHFLDEVIEFEDYLRSKTNEDLKIFISIYIPIIVGIISTISLVVTTLLKNGK